MKEEGRWKMEKVPGDDARDIGEKNQWQGAFHGPIKICETPVQVNRPPIINNFLDPPFGILYNCP